MTSRIRGIAALVALVLLIFGSPLALISWGNYPSPMIRVDDGSLILVILTSLGWLAWGVFSVATVAEMIGLASGHPRRIPALAAIQEMAGGLLVAAIALLPVSGLALNAPVSPTHTAALTPGTPDNPQTAESSSTAVPLVSPSTSASSASAKATSTQPPTAWRATASLPTTAPSLTAASTTESPTSASNAGAATITAARSSPSNSPSAIPETGSVNSQAGAEASTNDYVVAAGDDLWSISERLLGDGRRWRMLVELNPQLSDPLSELQAGTHLTVPATVSLATPTKATTKASGTKTVSVIKGDTLSELARDHLGKASRWPAIAKANPIITDPDHIEIGWKLRIPGAKATSKPVQKPAAPALPTTEKSSNPAETSRPTLPQPTGPTAATPIQTVASDASSPSQAVSDAATAPLAVGTLAAAAIIGTLEVRRALRQRARPIGHRRPADSAGAARLHTLLRTSGGPDSLEALASALRFVGHYCREHGRVLPEISRIGVSDQMVTIHWCVPAGEPPSGFTGDDSHWKTPTATAPNATGPCPFPALVSLGTAPDGEVVLIDAERSRLLGVCGPTGRRQDALCAMAVELACAPWSEGVRVIAIGDGTEVIQLAGADRVQRATLEQAHAMLRQVVERRRRALAHESLSQLRVDPDRCDAVASFVFCFLDEVPEQMTAEFERLLAGDPVGVAVLLGTHSGAEVQWEVSEGPTQVDGHLAGRPGRLAAHTIDSATRERLAELFTESEPVLAPWWAEDTHLSSSPIRDGDELDIIRLVEPAVHPQLSLIGPVELAGACGPEPTRSRQQLVELCAWLTEHPGATATQMGAALAIAESTRRSNLSRLRTWLGDDPDGQPYLPDAYSGRISLHPGISSDWQQLQMLLAPGINRISDKSLEAALQLIRGAPLADAAPGQWYWAEELRTDIASALRDVGVELAHRALAHSDTDLARWAAARALVVAPEDELLMCCRLRTEHLAGNREDAERIVSQITRQARTLGVDLMPETVELCQQIIEGRIRARV